MNPSSCSYPWKAMAIRPNGLVIPCCRFNQSSMDTFIDSGDNLRNSDIWKTIRTDMLAGKLIDNCKKCYDEEYAGMKSMRQLDSVDFIPVDNRAMPIENLEIAFSNLCNLACVHCSSSYSTKWYSEDVSAGRVNKTGIVKHSTNFKDWDLSKVTRLKIIGGEPMMEQDKFIELMSPMNLKNITLEINTNGTILPKEQLKSYISKCKRVYFCVSLDGLSTVNDWYRWPSKFDEIVNNMKTYSEWWGAPSNANMLEHSIQLIIHHVGNAISISDLPEFINYVETNLPAWRLNWDWIAYPQWQTIQSLPEEYKQKLITKFKECALTYKLVSSKSINPYLIAIHHLKKSSLVTWEDVKKNITAISIERNLDFLSMVPKLKGL
jgi:hypothetical protein